MNNLKRFAPGAATLLLSVAVACTGPDSFSLDSAPPVPSDPRYDDLVRRLDVDVVTGDGESASPLPKGCSDGSCNPIAFRDAIVDECRRSSVEASRCTQVVSCELIACAVDASICAANRLLEMATLVAPAHVVVSTAHDPLLVPPQDAETNSELARLAFELAAAANGDAARELVGLDGALCDTVTLQAPSPDRTVDGVTPTRAEVLAHQFVEAHEIAHESAEAMTRFSTAVADSQRGRVAELAEANFLATTAPFASRAAAAHLLVGGSAGLPAFGPIVANRGLFPVPRPSAEAQRAIELLRSAAPPPEALLNPDLDTDELMRPFSYASAAGAGGTGMIADVGLTARLAAIRADATLESAGTSSAAYDRLGVSRAALTEARGYVAAELRAFSRDQTHTVPPDRLIDGGTTTFPLFAATRVAPMPVPAAHLVARYSYQSAPTPFANPALRFPALPDSPSIKPGGSPDTATAMPTLSSLDDAAVTFARQILAHLGTQTPRIITTFVGGRGATPRPRVQMCWVENGADDVITVQVLGAPSASDLRVADGLAGLTCATEGSVEGAPCDMSELLVPVSGASGFTTRPAVAGTGYETEAFGHVAVSALSQLPGFARRTYEIEVVHRRAGRATSGPGDFEAIVGMTLTAPETEGPTGQYAYCRTLSVAPEVFAALVDVASPSTDDGSQPATHCAGVRTDGVLPLENELSTDGDGVESSWRIALAEARVAADEADQLGEDLIRNGLDGDVRAEQAIDELERLCGVSLNITSFADIHSSPRQEWPVGGACRDGYRLEAGPPQVCVLDPIAFAREYAATSDDAARLDECLGSDSAVPWVTYGATPLCAWEYPSLPGSLCRRPEGARFEDFPCPQAVPDSTNPSCASFRLPPALVVDGVSHAPQRVEIFDTLRLFVTPSPDEQTSTSGGEWALPCGELARLRVHGIEGSDSAFNTVLGSSLVDPIVMRGLAESLDFYPIAGDFAEVRAAGSRLAATGSGSTGVATSGFPCGSEPHPWCSSTAARSSLFCTQSRCGAASADPMSSAARLGRAQMNDELARAVLAARVITGASLRGMHTPYAQSRVLPIQTAALRFEHGRWTVPRGPLQYQFTAEGDTFYDRRDGDNDDFGASTMLGDMAAAASRVSLAGLPATCRDGDFIPRSAQWLLVPAHGTSLRHLVTTAGADATLCPELTSGIVTRQMPLLARSIGEGLDGTDPGTAVGALWSYSGQASFDPRIDSRVIHLLASGPRSGEYFISADSARTLDTLTQYWRDYDCPDGGRDYDDCVAHANDADVDYRALLEGNALFVAGDGLTEDDVFNGLELMCAASHLTAPSIFSGCTDPPPISSVTDMRTAEQFVVCQRNAIRTYAANGIISGLPRRIVDRLRSIAPSVHGQSSGEVGAEVSELGAAMTELRSAEFGMATTLDSIANEIRIIQNVMAQSRVSRALEDLNLASTIADRLTSCAVALLNAAGETGAASLTGAHFAYAAAGVSCGNSAAQIGIATRVRDLRAQGLDLQDEAAFINFETRFVLLTSSMSEQAVAIQAAMERIDGALTRIHNLESAGRTAVARALMLDDDGTGRYMAVDTVSRRRYSTALVRYQRAHERAVRRAYIARRAVEARLGMPLSMLTEDAEWVDELCRLPAIDYDRLRNADLGPTGLRGEDSSLFTAPSDYAGLYLGDYVRRLEDVISTYQREYPFREGTDTVVLSLRDDVLRVREDCERTVPNLLLQSEHLDVLQSNVGPGWSRWGCTDPADWPSYEGAPEQPNCVSVRSEALAPASSPISPLASDFSSTSVFDVEFGTPDPVVIEGTPRQSTTTSTRYEQWLTLEAGRYRMSWYGYTRTPAELMAAGLDSAEAIPPRDAVRVVRATNFRTVDDVEVWDEVELRSRAEAEQSAPPEAGAWRRYHFVFEVPARSQVAVFVSPRYGASATGRRVVRLAGMMLESIDSVRDAYTHPDQYPPGVPFGTAETRTRSLRVCEDNDGSTFRPEAFSYGYARVCPDGYDGNCAPELAQYRGYYEVSVPIDSGELQRLLVGAPAGFAAGNHNYRFERVAVNLVGTGLRDCSTLSGSTASTCYASGSINYSLLHTGPFTVWNAVGQSYDVPLFPGRIEGARALIAERYLTNPVSGVDLGLLAQVERVELQGRPLGGALTLRIWDDPGFRFDRLQDVQIVLGYRYWQHQR